MSWDERRSGKIRHADDARSDVDIDYARVIHSGAFRSLQGKTQILALGDDDFYRTRLTHSLEVAQVAHGLVQQLSQRTSPCPEAAPLPGAALIQAAGLAHDIGHPPFGHGGELALNYCMRVAGGFEGNGQTLRLLARLENYSPHHGADLTRRTLLAILKYPAARSAVVNAELMPTLSDRGSMISVLDAPSCRPPKAYYDEDQEVVDWILAPLSTADRERFQSVNARAGKHGETLHKSLDCSIMDLADDIAYGVHDLEDAIALGLIEEDGFRTAVSADACKSLTDALQRRPLDDAVAGYDGLVRALFGDAVERKRAIGRLVHHFLRSVEVGVLEGFEEPLLAHRAYLCARATRPAPAADRTRVDPRRARPAAGVQGAADGSSGL
jgi:dGTPase